jgi:hypothetical protein
LCGHPATFARVGDDDLWDVTCPEQCVQYRIAGPVVAELEQARRARNEKTLRLGQELSREAARARAEGGNLEITAPFWTAQFSRPHVR